MLLKEKVWNSQLKRINLITFFPRSYSYLSQSKIGKIIKNKSVSIRKISILKHCKKAKLTPDDKIYGGGTGMLLRPEVAFQCLSKIKKIGELYIPSPEGEIINPKMLDDILQNEVLTILCPRYEGYDERIAIFFKAKKFSIGNYIVSDGDVSAMVLISSFMRRAYLPKEAILNESFENENVLESFHYTRPKIWKGLEVPKELLSGNHKLIEEWRKTNRKK